MLPSALKQEKSEYWLSIQLTAVDFSGLPSNVSYHFRNLVKVSQSKRGSIVLFLIEKYAPR